MVMEILSTGEKIRRARIYKGYTLKYICGDKISVSKMSCIENDKIAPEDWVLEYLAEKLDLDTEYLKNDIKSQIRKNINELLKKNMKPDEYEKSLEYNLSYAEEYKYFDIAFDIMSMLFTFDLERNKLKKLQLLLPRYYDMCLKTREDKNYLIYYMDLAKYLYKSEEYGEAAGYYNTIKKSAEESDNQELLGKALFNECDCYIKIEDYEKAHEVAEELPALINYFEDDYKKAGVYHLLALLELRLQGEKFTKYEKKALSFYGENQRAKCNALNDYGITLIKINKKDEGIKYITRALKEYPKDDRIQLVSFMLMCISELVDNNVLEKAEKIIDETINYSIALDNVRFIEKAYHYKAVILGRKKEYTSMEMYMNLSLDALMRFGNKKEVYRRYLEMGEMYYKLNSISDALKYFNLAINLEKKI